MKCKYFKSLFQLELKRLFSKLKTTIGILFFLICLIFVQTGINQYKRVLENQDAFQKLEEEKVQLFTTYTIYGTYGFRLLFIPQSVSVFMYNSGAFPGITAFIDSGERLTIYYSLKGGNLFKNRNPDYSGVIYLIGSLIFLFYGLEVFFKKDFVNFLSDSFGSKKAVCFLIFSRLIIITSVILIILGTSYILIIANGVQLNISSNILEFIIIIIFYSWFFFLMGVAISRIKKKTTIFTTALILWFLLIFIIPTVINAFIADKAEKMPQIYIIEREKFKILMGFENRVIKKVGRLKEKAIDDKTGKIKNEWNQKKVQELYESYKDGELKSILQKEEKMISEMERNISRYHLISTFFPSTFYLSVNSELSSKGYKNLIAFYRYSLDLKIKFFLFYADKKFFSNHEKVEAFIKGEENLFYSESGLPVYFYPGVVLILLYMGVFFFISLRSPEKTLKKVTAKTNHIEIELPAGKGAAFILCKDDNTKKEIIRYFENDKTAVVLSKINTADFRIDLRPAECVKHFCRVLGVEEKRALENLKILGIRNLKESKALSHELTLKIYAAVRTAGDFESIIIDEFIKQESREFEKDFVKLVSSLEKAGKKIIFVSSTMYDTKGGLNDSIKIENFRVLSLPPFREITFR